MRQLETQRLDICNGKETSLEPKSPFKVCVNKIKKTLTFYTVKLDRKKALTQSKTPLFSRALKKLFILSFISVPKGRSQAPNTFSWYQFFKKMSRTLPNLIYGYVTLRFYNMELIKLFLSIFSSNWVVFKILVFKNIFLFSLKLKKFELKTLF